MPRSDPMLSQAIAARRCALMRGRRTVPTHTLARRPRCASALLLTLGLLAGPQAGAATHIGTLGPTYPIAEPDLLQFIAERLREKERSGELQRLMQDAQRRAVAQVQQPPPVAGLVATTVPRSFVWDPSFTLDRNIVDAQGRLLYPAGSRHNPLDVVSMGRQLLFFDARDPRQVQRAQALLTAQPGRIKPVLTGGSYLDLMRRWQQPVYHDQHGLLTRRLGIRQVPALVSQEGRRLRIDELALSSP